MIIGKELLTVITLAAAGCQPAPTFDIGLPGARPIAYDAIRDASGVLGYAEPLLGAKLATRRQGTGGPGTFHVEPSSVAGAWELPAGMTGDKVAGALRPHGVLERLRPYSDGQLWIADYRPHGGSPVRLLLIDGSHPAFEAQAVPEVRPGPHVYLIAYRT